MLRGLARQACTAHSFIMIQQSFEHWQWWLQENEGRNSALYENQALLYYLQQTHAERFLVVGASERWRPPWSGLKAPLMLETAIKPQIGTHFQSQVHQLGVASQSMQVVVLPHTLDWSNDREAILSEVWRILQANGLCFILLYNHSVLARWVWGRSSFRLLTKNLPETPLKNFSKLYKQQGFEKVLQTGLVPSHKYAKTHYWSAMLGMGRLIVLKKNVVRMRMRPVTGGFRNVDVQPAC